MIRRAQPRILILIAQHLHTAPRPQKEALALAKAGYAVTIACAWHDNTFAQRDAQLVQAHGYELVCYADFRPQYRLKRFLFRAQSKFARLAWQRRHWFYPDLLGYGVRAMYGFARRFAADLTIVHSEGGLWVGDRLLRENRRVGVDFEDWYSNDLLPEARAQRPIERLWQLERHLSQHCRYRLTPSNAMAQQLASTFGTDAATCVYNVFPFAERGGLDGEWRDRRQGRQNPSLHWFSQTIGPGRGLEMLCDALSRIGPPFELHLRGRCSPTYEADLRQRLRPEQRQQLIIHPTVPNGELLSRITEHDIGLALEQPHCPSRDLTITNKFFQYLQGGLAVIATQTQGQTEAVRAAQCGTLVPPADPVALADAVATLMTDGDRRRREQQAALAAAEQIFCWERIETRVIEAVVAAFQFP